MEDPKSIIKDVNIDEAINISSGTRKYQQLMVLILLLGVFSVSPLIMCTRLFLPQSSDLWFKGSASDELASLSKDSSQANVFETFYSQV